MNTPPPIDPELRAVLDVSTDVVTTLVADEIAAYDAPEARASDRGTEYLRYNDDIVTVGPEGQYPCSIRVEDTGARYSGGGFIFLGPGFIPGSPAGGSGGSSGGPGGTK